MAGTSGSFHQQAVTTANLLLEAAERLDGSRLDSSGSRPDRDHNVDPGSGSRPAQAQRRDRVVDPGSGSRPAQRRDRDVGTSSQSRLQPSFVREASVAGEYRSLFINNWGGVGAKRKSSQTASKFKKRNSLLGTTRSYALQTPAMIQCLMASIELS